MRFPNRPRSGDSASFPFGALIALFLAGALSIPGGAQTKKGLPDHHPRLAREVRHELVMLPYYGVFDNLEFSVQGIDTVALSRQLTHPTLETASENCVGKPAGCGQVPTNTEALP